jgi:sigma-B regulation protein RsbU (phosphoserine phosphatase)
MNHTDVTAQEKRITQLEGEIEELTIALAQAWDQLAPFLQEAPAQTNTTEVLTHILHALMAAADVDRSGIYLFHHNDWLAVPTDTPLPTDLRYQLKMIQPNHPLQWPGEKDSTATAGWLFAPVVADQHTIGAIGIGQERNSRHLTAAEMRILSGMAERVAGQIAATQLTRSREREAAARQELEVASRIQRSIQPAKLPSIDGLDICTHWEPARQVGGDGWGWVETENEFAWFVLDVAGKGLPAALAAMALHTAIRLGLKTGLTPLEILRIINEDFYDSYTETDLIATAAIYSLDLNSAQFEQVNAGHLPTLIRQGGEWHRLEATAPPIGVLPDMTAETQRLALEPNDLIISYSDGFTEIETNEGLWGEEGLLGAVAPGKIDAKTIVDSIVQTAHEVAKNTRLSDDQTLVIVTYQPRGGT